MSGAAIGIWARVSGVTLRDVDDALWKHRQLVKTWCMRGTLHLLAARDLPLHVAALKTRTTYRTKSWLKSHKITLDEIDRITAEARNSLNGLCLTREELVNDIAKRAGLRRWVRKEMSSGWGSLLHPAAYRGNLCFGPSKGKNVTFVRPDQWIGRWDEPDGEEALKILFRRFVTSYGPCSQEDFVHWWGILEKSAGKVLGVVNDELEEVEFEGCKVWLKKDDVENVTQSKRVPSLRLVPSFDPYVMFYSPRELLVERKFRERVFRQLAGWVSPVLLIDGIAAGIWEHRKKSSWVHVRVEPFRKLSSDECKLVKEEAHMFGEFLGAKTELSLASS